MKAVGLAAVVLFSVAACNGCMLPTPQQNLSNQLRTLVGRSLDTPFYHLRPELLLERKELTNGILQSRYNYGNGCVLIVEASSKTRIITNAWPEGSEKSCVLPP